MQEIRKHRQKSFLHISPVTKPSPSQSHFTTIALRGIALEECTLRTAKLSFDTSGTNVRETSRDDTSPTTTRQAVRREFWRCLCGTSDLLESFEARRRGERRAVVLGDESALRLDYAADAGLGAFDHVEADYSGSWGGGAFVEGDGEC